jgi:HEAT repeat protein
LGDRDQDVRESAADALSRIGTKAKAAVPALVVALRDSAWSVRREAAGALARVGPEPSDAMPALKRVLKEDLTPEVRAAAASAIISVARTAPDRRQAVLELILALKDSDPKVRKAAASALGASGSDASDAVVPLAAVLLKDPDRQARSWAADALGEIGPVARPAVPSLIAALDDSDPWLRRIAAEALGKIGSASEDIISALIIVSRDPTETAREGAIGAMVGLAERSARAGDTTAIEPLKRASAALKSGDARTRAIEALDRLEPALDSLEAKQRADWRTWTAGLIEQHPATVALVALFGLYLAWLEILRFAILNRSPLRVLSWSRALAGRFEVTLPVMLGKPKVSLRSLVLAGFENHPMVLDAWVARHASAARERFLRSETVQARSTYVPIPLFVNDKPIPSLDARAIQSIQGKDRWSIGIWGEDGLGKTTLACQLALWGLADAPADRLCPDVQMLPVLIEPGTGYDVHKDAAAFKAAVKEKLQELIEPAESIPDDLFERLLRARRILVLLDGVSDSETSASDRALSSHPDFPASALVITSRVRVPGSTILLEPRRLDRDHLLPFVSTYLARADLADLPDVTIYQVCARLAEMAGPDRGISPLLAGLLVEKVAAAVRAGRSPLDLPASVPELVLPIESDR